VCGEVEDGVQAVEEVRRVRPDVVVLNITMPVLNGFEAAREIKKHVPQSAIVILSTPLIKASWRKPRKLVCKHLRSIAERSTQSGKLFLDLLQALMPSFV
jgi:CheY-like chemotaxis protein